MFVLFVDKPLFKQQLIEKSKYLYVKLQKLHPDTKVMPRFRRSQNVQTHQNKYFITLHRGWIKFLLRWLRLKDSIANFSDKHFTYLISIKVKFKWEYLGLVFPFPKLISSYLLPQWKRERCEQNNQRRARWLKQYWYRISCRWSSPRNGEFQPYQPGTKRVGIYLKLETDLLVQETIINQTNGNTSASQSYLKSTSTWENGQRTYSNVFLPKKGSGLSPHIVVAWWCCYYWYKQLCKECLKALKTTYFDEGSEQFFLYKREGKPT